MKTKYRIRDSRYALGMRCLDRRVFLGWEFVAGGTQSEMEAQLRLCTSGAADPQLFDAKGRRIFNRS